MATTTSTATVVSLHPKTALTPAQRAAAYRARKRQNCAAPKTVGDEIASPLKASVTPVTPVPPLSHREKPVTTSPSRRVTPSRQLAPALLTVTSFALAAVAVAMNGVFAHTLGSSEVSSWLFCAIGVAADLVALSVPACAASLWQTHQRGAALAGWLVWSMTFAFTVTAGIGFASVNISDVTLSRAARVTPAIETSRAQLADAMTTRDRECANGIGKNCRAREEAVVDRRRALDLAMSETRLSADPQAEATGRIVAWLSFGTVRPAGEDFATLRLILLALLPQLGGILLMVARRAG